MSIIHGTRKDCVLAFLFATLVVIGVSPASFGSEPTEVNQGSRPGQKASPKRVLFSAPKLPVVSAPVVPAVVHVSAKASKPAKVVLTNAEQVELSWSHAKTIRPIVSRPVAELAIPIAKPERHDSTLRMSRLVSRTPKIGAPVQVKPLRVQVKPAPVQAKPVVVQAKPVFAPVKVPVAVKKPAKVAKQAVPVPVRRSPAYRFKLGEPQRALPPRSPTASRPVVSPSTPLVQARPQAPFKPKVALKKKASVRPTDVASKAPVAAKSVAPKRLKFNWSPQAPAPQTVVARPEVVKPTPAKVAPVKMAPVKVAPARIAITKPVRVSPVPVRAVPAPVKTVSKPQPWRTAPKVVRQQPAPKAKPYIPAPVAKPYLPATRAVATYKPAPVATPAVVVQRPVAVKKPVAKIALLPAKQVVLNFVSKARPAVASPVASVISPKAPVAQKSIAVQPAAETIAQTTQPLPAYRAATAPKPTRSYRVAPPVRTSPARVQVAVKPLPRVAPQQVISKIKAPTRATVVSQRVKRLPSPQINRPPVTHLAQAPTRNPDRSAFRTSPAPLRAVPMPRAAPPVNESPIRRRTSVNTSLRRPAMPLVTRRIDERVRHAFKLAQRGAMYSARAEFRQALILCGMSLDAEHNTDQYSRAMREGLTALSEADDFAPHDRNLESKINLSRLIRGHRTQVLKRDDVNLNDLSPLVALQSYYSFGRERLSTAAGNQRAASMALYGLARVNTALASKKTLGVHKAIALHQAALITDSGNYMAANELGVLLARYGQMEEAAQVFEHSVKAFPQPEAWDNLAKIYGRMGMPEQANHARQQYTDLRAARRRGEVSSPDTMVRWVSPAAFSGHPIGSAEVPVQQPTQKPENRTVEKSSEPVKTAAGWSLPKGFKNLGAIFKANAREQKSTRTK